ncbi:MAG: ornithine cyclodeaminase [Halieaceae bacterium]|jgi:ornithine cyclodeaminase
MSQIRLLTEAELRAAVTLDQEALECIAQGFLALAAGGVVMPPILSLPVAAANGEIDVKSAYIPGLGSIAVKVSTGFYNNPLLGLPSSSGLMVLLSAATGQPEAVLLDNGYLTDLRTAAAGALAARVLSREDASTVCVVGTGIQARLQLQALLLVRPIQRVVFWGRDHQKALAAAAEVQDALALQACAEREIHKAIAQADIVVTATPSTSPLLKAEWLRPGMHVTAVGADGHGKCELEPACLVRADLYVPDRLAQTRIRGELAAAIAVGRVSEQAKFPELGAVLAGSAPGRTAAQQITIADLTGTGAQDTAIAVFARARCEARGAGILVS